MTRRLRRYRLLAFCAGVALAVVLLSYGLAPYQRDIAVFTALYAMVAVGLTLLMGFGGQISLGQGGFMALGAYTTGILAARHGMPILPAVILAPLVAALAGYVIGLPLLRLRGHHLAIATLAFAILVTVLLQNLSGLTGGPIGISGIPALSVAGVGLSGRAFYFLAWVVALLTLVLAHFLVHSRPGRALRALAENEEAAESLGVAVPLYRLHLFALAAALAGLAGGLYASYLGYISPDGFGVQLSILFLIMVVIGGLGSVWGALVGTVVIQLLTQGLQQLATHPGLPARAPVVLETVVYAVILVLIMLFLPSGLLPGLQAGSRRFRRPPAE